MQLSRITMATVLTFVFMLVGMPTLHAEDTRLKPQDVRAACESWEADKFSSMAACISAYSGGSSSAATQTDCEKAEEAYQKTNTEFNKACGAFKLNGKRCEEKIASCSEDLEDYTDEDSDDDVDRAFSSSGKTVDREKYEACPIDAIKDNEEAKEQVKTAKDEIKDLKDKIKEKKADVLAAKTEIETAQAERQEADNERDAQFEKDQKEKELDLKGKDEDAQKRLDDIEQKIRELDQAKNDQDVQYTVDLAKIEGICEEIAERALSARIEGQIKQVQTGQLKRRNLQDQLSLKSGGRTSDNEKFRAREIARCRKNDARWKKPIEQLNINYKNTRLKIENAIKELLLQREKEYKKLIETLPQEKQKEAQELLVRYQKDKMNIKQKFDQKIGQCGQFNPSSQAGQQSEAPNGCTGLSAKLSQETADLANLEKELREKEADLKYYLELERTTASFFNKSKAGDSVDLLAAAEDYKLSLERIVSNCPLPQKANLISSAQASIKNMKADRLSSSSTTAPASGVSIQGTRPTTAPTTSSGGAQ